MFSKFIVTSASLRGFCQLLTVLNVYWSLSIYFGYGFLGFLFDIFTGPGFGEKDPFDEFLLFFKIDFLLYLVDCLEFL